MTSNGTPLREDARPLAMPYLDPRFVPFDGRLPMIGAGAFVADTARVIGDVTLGDDVSVWYGSVLRGDVHWIRVGRGVNIQDLAVVHVTTARNATSIGDDVTIGHRATIHGCSIEPRALIGMAATILDGAIIGEEAMVGAGALVTPGTVIPPRTLALGAPAKPVRALDAAELAHLRGAAAHYVTLARRYLEAGIGKVLS